MLRGDEAEMMESTNFAWKIKRPDFHPAFFFAAWRFFWN
jgi:hypothetical protein